MTVIIQIECGDCYNYSTSRIEIEDDAIVAALESTDNMYDAAVHCTPEAVDPSIVVDTFPYILDVLGDAAKYIVAKRIQDKYEEYRSDSAEVECDNCKNTITEEDIEVSHEDN